MTIRCQGFVAPNNRLTDAEAGYIAGMLDGEGSVGLNAYCPFRSWHFSLRVCVANTSVPLLEWLAKTTGCGSVQNMRSANSLGHKAAYQWTIRREEALWLLPQIQPYLVIKGRQAEIALRFLEIRGTGHGVPKEAFEEILRLCAEMRELNRRGLRELKSGVREERIPPPPGICPGCGGEVDRTGYAAKIFCTTKCRERFKNQARPKIPPKQGQCGHCGNPYTGMGRKTYCSNRCRQQAYVARKDVPPPAPETVSCKFCGNSFTRTDPRKVYCGHNCIQRAHTARKRQREE